MENKQGEFNLIEDESFNLEQSADIDLHPNNPEGPEADKTANVSSLTYQSNLYFALSLIQTKSIITLICWLKSSKLSNNMFIF